MKIVSFPHHFPCFYTPFIGFFYQKIRGKTSIDEISGRDLVSLILFPPHGQIELSGFSYYGTVFPMFTISAIYITMLKNLYLAYGSHAKDSIEKTPDLFYFPFCLNKIYHFIIVCKVS